MELSFHQDLTWSKDKNHLHNQTCSYSFSWPCHLVNDQFPHCCRLQGSWFASLNLSFVRLSFRCLLNLPSKVLVFPHHLDLLFLQFSSSTFVLLHRARTLVQTAQLNLTLKLYHSKSNDLLNWLSFIKLVWTYPQTPCLPYAHPPWT
mgnify:CR=1 FL=1